MQSSSSTVPATISDINQSCVLVVESSVRLVLILSALPVIWSRIHVGRSRSNSFINTFQMRSRVYFFLSHCDIVHVHGSQKSLADDARTSIPRLVISRIFPLEKPFWTVSSNYNPSTENPYKFFSRRNTGSSIIYYVFRLIFRDTGNLISWHFDFWSFNTLDASFIFTCA